MLRGIFMAAGRHAGPGRRSTSTCWRRCARRRSGRSSWRRARSTRPRMAGEEYAQLGREGRGSSTATLMKEAGFLAKQVDAARAAPRGPRQRRRAFRDRRPGGSGRRACQLNGELLHGASHEHSGADGGPASARTHRRCGRRGAAVRHRRRRRRRAAARSAPAGTSDGPGAGYFPFYIGLILCIASAGIFYQARVRQGARHRRRSSTASSSSGCCRCCCRRWSTCWRDPCSSGIYVASAIYIALFMIVARQVLAGSRA